MRVFNRSHLPWAVFVVLATMFAAWLYLGNFHADQLPAGLQLPHRWVQQTAGHGSVGGTPLGLTFGAIALGIFIFASLLGVRKKLVLWRIGSAQRWLRAHLWLTLLTIPLVILHSGFRFGGPMTTLLIVLYLIVMVSGIYGLALQHQMPRIMMERLPAESVYEQIPHIRAQLYAAAEKMRNSLKPAAPAPAAKTEANTPAPVAAPAAPAAAAPPSSAPAPPAKPAGPVGDVESEAALLDFLDRQILPYLAARRGDRMLLGSARFSEDTFRFVKLRVTPGYRERVEEIQGWCDERRMLDLQTKLQHWLHGWLFVHAPISFLLLMLTMWHAVVAVFYY